MLRLLFRSVANESEKRDCIQKLNSLCVRNYVYIFFSHFFLLFIFCSKVGRVSGKSFGSNNSKNYKCNHNLYDATRCRILFVCVSEWVYGHIGILNLPPLVAMRRPLKPFGKTLLWWSRCFREIFNWTPMILETRTSRTVWLIVNVSRINFWFR